MFAPENGDMNDPEPQFAVRARAGLLSGCRENSLPGPRPKSSMSWSDPGPRRVAHTHITKNLPGERRSPRRVAKDTLRQAHVLRRDFLKARTGACRPGLWERRTP